MEFLGIFFQSQEQLPRHHKSSRITVLLDRIATTSRHAQCQSAKRFACVGAGKI